MTAMIFDDLGLRTLLKAIGLKIHPAERASTAAGLSLWKVGTDRGENIGFTSSFLLNVTSETCSKTAEYWKHPRLPSFRNFRF